MEQKFINEEISGIKDSNLKKLKQLFPSVFKDGQVDFDELKNLLGEFEGTKTEKYEFDWIGKKEATQNAISEISGVTLKYYPEESKDIESTENLYIEGDNLKVLKLLRNNYANKVKMIYIDPPYNTGNDTFVYPDNFKKSDAETKEEMGVTKNGEKVVNILKDNMYRNKKEFNQYHSTWLSMMYARIKVGWELLKSNGIMFISIDDNEVENLKKMCDEIFQSRNFVAQIIIEGTPKNDPYIVSTAHEYCLVYVKDFEIAKEENWGVSNDLYKRILQIYNNSNPNYSEIEQNLKEFYINEDLQKNNIANYKFADEQGIYRKGPIDDPQAGGPHDERINPYTKEVLMTPKGGWRCNLDTWNEWIKNNLIEFPDKNDKLCSKKTYLSEQRRDLLRSVYKIQTRKDTEMLERLFGKKVFQYPKPVNFIKMLIDSSTSKDSNDIVLDFFSGSGTTAHAVMEVNKDGGNRKWILVQIQEDLEESLNKSSSNKEKQILKNAVEYLKENNKRTVLTEIGKERIRLCGENIKLNTQEKIDYGFKVFKLDSTNINWEKEEYRYNIRNYIFNEGLMNIPQEELLQDFVYGAKDIDIVYEILLRYYGMPLSSKIEKLDNIGNRTYSIGGELIVCLEDKITVELVNRLAKVHFAKLYIRDSSFKGRKSLELKQNLMTRLNLQKSYNGEKVYKVEFI